MTKSRFADHLIVPDAIRRLYETTIKPAMERKHSPGVVAIDRASARWFHGNEPTAESIFFGQDTAVAYQRTALTFPDKADSGFSFLDIETGNARSIYDSLRLSDSDYKTVTPILESLSSLLRHIVDSTTPAEMERIPDKEKEGVAMVLRHADMFFYAVQDFARVYSGNPKEVLNYHAPIDQSSVVFLPQILISPLSYLRVAALLDYVHKSLLTSEEFFPFLQPNKSTNDNFPFQDKLVQIHGLVGHYPVESLDSDLHRSLDKSSPPSLRPIRNITSGEYKYWSAVGSGIACDILTNGHSIPSAEPQRIIFLVSHGIHRFGNEEKRVA